MSRIEPTRSRPSTSKADTIIHRATDHSFYDIIWPCWICLLLNNKQYPVDRFFYKYYVFIVGWLYAKFKEKSYYRVHLGISRLHNWPSSSRRIMGTLALSHKSVIMIALILLRWYIVVYGILLFLLWFLCVCVHYNYYIYGMHACMFWYNVGLSKMCFIWP